MTCSNESIAACNHLPVSEACDVRVNGGLAMWLPSSLNSRLRSSAKFDKVVGVSCTQIVYIQLDGHLDAERSGNAHS